MQNAKFKRGKLLTKAWHNLVYVILMFLLPLFSNQFSMDNKSNTLKIVYNYENIHLKYLQKYMYSTNLFIFVNGKVNCKRNDCLGKLSDNSEDHL